ncbi:MAG: hypothetical protein JXR50_07510 [Prolixibacteraceae bacterium]|nr:hypothetical protein [Prolixibacteraceae bacterium]MBN2649571.1 hypothetical protein [Prolixibacteraceae bacterium]
MNSLILLVLLQFNLFGIKGEPMANTKMYVNDAATGELIAFSKIGFSGEFEFPNLDPGNYILSMTMAEKPVWYQDKRKHQKFQTDLLVAYNRDKHSLGWKNDEGNMIIEFDELSKIADALMPRFENYYPGDVNCTENDSISNETESEDIDAKGLPTPNKQIDILHFTVTDQYGTIGGSVQSVSQKDYHKLFVGKDEIKYEDAGKVIVIKRDE